MTHNRIINLAALCSISAIGSASIYAADVNIGTGTIDLTGSAISGNTVYGDNYIFDETGGVLNYNGRQIRLSGSIIVEDGVAAKITSSKSTYGLDYQLRMWTNIGNPSQGQVVLGDNSILEIDLFGNDRYYKVRFSNKAYGSDVVGTNIAWGSGAKIKLTNGYFNLCNADSNGNPAYSGGVENDPNVELSNYIFNGGVLCTDIGHDIIRMKTDQAIGKVDMDNGNDLFSVESGVKMASQTDSARQNSWILFYNTGNNYGFDNNVAESTVANGYGGQDTLQIKSLAETHGINFLFGTNNDTAIIEDGALMENGVIRMNRGDDSITVGEATIVMDSRDYTSMDATANLTIYADIDLGAREAINAKPSDAVDSDNDTATFNGTTIIKSTDHTFLATGEGNDTVSFNNAKITNTSSAVFADMGAGDDNLTFNGTNLSAPSGTTIADLGDGDDAMTFTGTASINDADSDMTFAMGAGNDTVKINGGANITAKGRLVFSGTGVNRLNVSEASTLTLEESVLTFEGEVALGLDSKIAFSNDADGTLSKIISDSFVGEGGVIAVLMDAGDLAAGYVLDLVDADTITGSVRFDFSQAVLGEGLYWDTSTFFTDGSIFVREIPEASTCAAIFGALAIGLAACRRRK